jgi:hypothetical protein
MMMPGMQLLLTNARCRQRIFVAPPCSTETGDDTTDLWLISTAPGAAPLKLLAENVHSDASLVVFSPHNWEPQLGEL